MRDAALFDLDDTLADTTARRPHLPKPESYAWQQWDHPDWALYHEGSENDPCHEPVAMLARMLAGAGYAIILTTSRPNWAEDRTRRWLTKQQIPCDLLLLRASNCAPADLKAGHATIARAAGYRLVWGFDDHAHVCRAWREDGITTFMIGEGATY